MSELSSKYRRLIYKLKHDYLSIENVILGVAILLCLTWTYQSIASMTRNWALVERLNSEKKSLELKKVEVETAELENEYYKSEEYQELAARKFAGKQLYGEHMVYLPENSEAAKTKHQDEKIAAVDEVKEYSNFELWMKYLLP